MDGRLARRKHLLWGPGSQPTLWMLFPRASEDYEASFLREQSSWAAIVFSGLELKFGHQEDIGLKWINNLNLGQGQG